MHIAIFGAGGKIAKMLLWLLLERRLTNLSLTLCGPSVSNIKGSILDIEDSLYLQQVITRGERVRVEATISASFQPRTDVDLVIVLAAKWPTPQEKQRFIGRKGASRLVQSYTNFELVQNVAYQIKQEAPRALTIIVTNQSDMMANAAREILVPERVLGFGGIIDSARFRRALSSRISPSPGETVVDGHIIGFHDETMIPLMSSIKIEPSFIPSSKHIEDALVDARQGGNIVSRLQKKPVFPEINTGAVISPAAALFDVIKALAGWSHYLIAPFNVVLPSDPIANRYGVQPGFSLSVPIVLSRGGYAHCLDYTISPIEADLLRAGSARFVQEYTAMKEHIAQCGPMTKV